MSIASFFCLVSLIQSQPPTPQARQEIAPAEVLNRVEKPALEWIRKNLVSFESDIPDQKMLESISQSIGSPKLIGLGEPTHGDHQAQSFKNHVIRKLIRDGKVNAVFFEINRSAGEKIDKFVNQKGGDIVETVMDSGLFQIWKTDDTASLLAWLKGYVERTGKPIRVYGVDCQDPEEDLSVTAKYLTKKDRKLAEKIRLIHKDLFNSSKEKKTYFAWVKSRKEGDYKSYIDLNQEILKTFEANAEKWKRDSEYSEALYATRVADQAFRAFEFEFGSKPRKQEEIPIESYARRDVFMGQNVLYRLGENAKGVLWAHDGHVMRKTSYEEFQTLGSTVAKSLQSDYVCVGFAYTYGLVNAKKLTVGSTDIVKAQKEKPIECELKCDRKGDLGEFLSRLGKDRFLVDFRKLPAELEEWGKISYYRGNIGWGYDEKMFGTVVAEEGLPSTGFHDLLVYFKHLSPSTLWDLPARSAALKKDAK